MTDERRSLAVRTARNAVWHLSGFIFVSFLGLFVTSVVVGRIGVANYGWFTLLTAMLAPLNLANLGFGEATVKYVAQHVHEGNFAKASQYINTTYFMNLLTGLAGALMISVFGRMLLVSFFHGGSQDMAVVGVCIHLAAVGWFFNQAAAVMVGIPAAFQKYDCVAAGNMAVTVVTSLLILSFVMSGWGLIGYTSATVVGNIVNFIYWYIVAKRIFPSAKIRPALDREVWKSSFHFGGWQAISQLCSIIFTHVEKYILGVVLSPAAVGVYNVSFTLYQGACSAAFRMSEVLFPAFSSLSSESVELKADSLMKSSWLLTSIAVCMISPFIPLSNSLISLWISREVAADAGRVLQNLSIAGIMGSAAYASYFFMLGMGRTRLIMFISVAAGITTLLVSTVVLPAFGLLAAGWSAIAATAGTNLFFLWALRRMFGGTLALFDLVRSMYLPQIAGILIAWAAAWSGFGSELSSWPALIASYICISGVIMCSILLSDRLLPHGKERYQYLMSLAKNMVYVKH